MQLNPWLLRLKRQWQFQDILQLQEQFHLQYHLMMTIWFYKLVKQLNHKLDQISLFLNIWKKKYINLLKLIWNKYSLTDSDKKVIIIDVRNKQVPALATTLTTSYNIRIALITKDGKYLILGGTSPNTIDIHNFTNPASPSLL